MQRLDLCELMNVFGSAPFGEAAGCVHIGDPEKTGAIPTSHRMSPASLVAEATASRAIPRSKHCLDLAEETGSAVVTWTKTKYRYPLSPRFFPPSLETCCCSAWFSAA